MNDLSTISSEREPAEWLDEAMLVAAAQANPSELDALYRRYFARIYRYLLARTETPDDAGPWSWIPGSRWRDRNRRRRRTGVRGCSISRCHRANP